MEIFIGILIILLGIGIKVFIWNALGNLYLLVLVLDALTNGSIGFFDYLYDRIEELYYKIKRF